MRGASTMRIALVAVILLLAVGGGYWYAFERPGGANAADPPKATAPGASSGDQPAPRSTGVEVGRVALGSVVPAIGAVDRKSVGQGTRVSDRNGLGGRRYLNKKQSTNYTR